MIPKNKHDENAIALLQAASDEEVIENADHLLAWLQDINWPIFNGILRRLASLGDELFEPVSRILEGNDSIWKANVVGHLIPSFSQEAQELYTKSLESILFKYDENDLQEGVIGYVEIQLRNRELAHKNLSHQESI